MNCPTLLENGKPCGLPTKVIDSRPIGNGLRWRRRHECPKGHRHTSHQHWADREHDRILDERRREIQKKGEQIQKTRKQRRKQRDATELKNLKEIFFPKKQLKTAF